MSTLTIKPSSVTLLSAIRTLCGVIAAIVVVDAISVGAPGLALLAVPFIVGAVGLRRGSTLPMTGLLALSALYVLLGVNYAVANGFHAGWGDLLFAYAGTPAAAALGILAVQSLAHRRRMAEAT